MRGAEDRCAVLLREMNPKNAIPISSVLYCVAVLRVTWRLALVARVMSITRLDFSYFPVTRSDTRD
jgi:hypothetical protein